ncbi:hypothetical protein Tco_1308519, partial [Tanacetum coccineum]
MVGNDGQVSSAVTNDMEFHIVRSSSKYNILFGRTTIKQLCPKVSLIRSHIQFPTKSWLATVKSEFPGMDAELTTVVDNMTVMEIKWEALPGYNENEEKVVINKNHPDQPVIIGKHLPHQ